MSSNEFRDIFSMELDRRVVNACLQTVLIPLDKFPVSFHES